MSVAALPLLAIFAGNLVSCSAPRTARKTPPEQILEKCRSAYADMTSYSDDGEVLTKSGTYEFKHTFSIKLARPAYYRIAWVQAMPSGLGEMKGAVWSSGNGDFLEFLGKAQRQETAELALAGATGVSGGAAATVPALFLKTSWGDPLGPRNYMVQNADSRVEEVDCYTFESRLQGIKTTLWIGKQDFLIHRYQTTSSAESLRQTLDAAKKMNPQVKMPQGFVASDIVSTETHRHIVLNKELKPADFEK